MVILLEYEISTDRARLDVSWVVRALLSTYWASSRTDETIRRSLEQSLCFGIFDRASGGQIGFARVITDGATFGWVCDFFIEPTHRGKGVGKWLMESILADGRLKGVTFHLATKDAHGLYERYGFVRNETMRKAPSSA